MKKKWKSIRSAPWFGFSVFVFLICLLNLLLNTINGRFWLSDFKVYYSAAENLLSGGTVYGQAYGLGSGFYKYSPAILFCFIPYTLFSYTVASVIHFILLSFACWYTFIIIRRMLADYFPVNSLKHENLLLSLAFVFILLHLVRELYLGNINIILLLLSLLALQNYLKDKPIIGSLLFGIVLLTKPFFLILIIPLVLRKNWKALAWLGVTLMAGLAVPFLIPGPSKAVTLYSGWMTTMLRHDEGFPGLNSIDYLMRYYFDPGLPSYAEYLVILAAGMAAGFFVILNLRKESISKSPEIISRIDFIYEWFLLLALIPNLVRTDSEHFLAAAPILAFIIYSIANTKRYWMIPILIVLFFFYGGNSYDLLGKELSQQLFTMGLLGLSNLLILILSLFLFFDFRKGKVTQDKAGISSWSP